MVFEDRGQFNGWLIVPIKVHRITASFGGPVRSPS